MNWFANINPVLQALLATLFTWGMTGAGSSLVFFVKTVNRKFLDGMLGFAAGVMIAASYWSLLAPAIEMSTAKGHSAWIPAVVGFLLGGGFVLTVDKLLPIYHPSGGNPNNRSSWQRSTLLILAITMHNIPEGLAVGVAFGALAHQPSGTGLASAIALAIGIGIQNFPEGTAVSVPLRREGMHRLKSFWYGQLSGFVEPIAGVLGAIAVIYVEPILPYTLAFAAGAMIFVVVHELIPAAQEEEPKWIGTVGAMLGFAVMMALDVALG